MSNTSEIKQNSYLSRLGEMYAVMKEFPQRLIEHLPKARHQHAVKPATFELIDILFEFLMEKMSREDEKDFHSYTALTLRTQLEAVLREQYQLPFQQDYSIVDFRKFIDEHILHISHPGYRDTDLGEYFRKAALVASSQEQKNRYKAESDQFQKLKDLIWADLNSTENPAFLPDGTVNTENWSATSAQTAVPANIAQALGLKGGETVFVRQRYSLVLPMNTQLYPDGKSYLNVYSLVYIPHSKQMVLVTDHLYQAISMDVHSSMLQKLSDKKLPDMNPHWTDQAKEQFLLKLVVTLPETLKTTQTVNLFLDLLRQFPTSLPKSGQVEIDQQRIMQKFLGSRSNLSRAVAFLTQVLIAEHRVCSQNPSATNTLLQRLHLAMEMVFNPLFSGEKMNVAASKQVYMDELFRKYVPSADRSQLVFRPVRSWMQTLPQQPVASQKRRLQELQSTVSDLQVASRRMDMEAYVQSPERNIAIEKLSIHAPGILNRVVGEAMCHTGIAGGWSESMATSMSSSSGSLFSLDMISMHKGFSQFSSLVESGPMRSRSFLENAIGPERAKLWKTGTCVCGDECYFPGKDQLVGECGVCYFCEQMPKHKFDEAQSQKNLENWFKQEQNSAQEAIDTGKPFWTIRPGDFLPYMIAARDIPLR